MTPVTLSGLNSGLDTSSVINQLLQGDRARVSKMQWRQTAISSQQSQLKDVATKLTAVLNAVKALTSDSAYARTQQVVSSDAAKVAVAPLGGSGVGGYALQVDRMASAAQRTYAYDPDSDQTLTVGTSTFNFPAGTKIADAATKINASNDATVYAAAVEGKLILSARTSGAQSDFTAAGLVEDVSAAKVGDRLDALIRLDGDATARRSPTNVIENLIPGLRLTIKSTTTSPVSISISQPALDEEALKTKVKAVATAFNALADTVRNVTTEKTIKDPKSASQAAKGGLFGDRALISLAGQARTLLAAAAAAGIKSPKAGNSEEGKSGHLSSDDAAIAKALEDPAQLKAVFAALAQKLEPFVKTQNSGLIDARVASGTRQAKQITDAMTRQNARIDTEQKRLATQFASMEKALGLSQSQQAWLASAISALP